LQLAKYTGNAVQQAFGKIFGTLNDERALHIAYCQLLIEIKKPSQE
jgi:hypothetical protein